MTLNDKSRASPITSEHGDSEESSPASSGSHRGLAGAAGVIAGITLLARITGFGRVLVFTAMVGLTTVGDVYQTINTLPNVVYEIVAGGALSAVVIPLISSAIARGDAAEVNRTASALLTWALLVLTPCSVLLAVFATPITTALLGADATQQQVAVGTRMLLVFAPQLMLYGVGIVLTGILQAHHSFAWPALAPMLSSLTVIAAYIAFGVVAGRGAPIGSVDLADELILSVGTTAGVAVLTLCLIVPLRRTGVVLRPTLCFVPGSTENVRNLLFSGVASVGAQYAALLVVLVLLQSGPEGTVVAFNLVHTIFLVPWGVLAVPIATSAFPRLSAAFAKKQYGEYRRTLHFAASSVVILTAAAAAVLIAASGPLAEVLMSVSSGRSDSDAVAGGIAAYAPGLIGFGLLALLSRALYATGASLLTACTIIGGWGVAILASVILVPRASEDGYIVAVGAANTLGMSVVGVGLSLLVMRSMGRSSLAGVLRTTLSSITAGIAGVVLGTVVVGYLPQWYGFAALGSVGVYAVIVAAVFFAVLALLDRSMLLHLAGSVSRVRTRGEAYELAADPELQSEITTREEEHR